MLSLIEIILLAVALGIDCFVVSFCQGLILTKDRVKNSFSLAICMGIFQGIMPVISYFATNIFIEYLQQFAKIIVLFIFLALGIKFICEALKNTKDCQIIKITFISLISMGIATSIDALGAGVSLKLTSSEIILSSVVIGLASFFMSLSGFWSGNFLKKFQSKYLEFAGGIILILLALKTLISN